jgi:hypothetical protein
MIKAVGNLPSGEPLRWTLSKAARELDVTEYLLGKRLKDGGELPDSGGCYSTSQLIRAMFGSLHVERLRWTKEQADKVALENAILRSEYLPRQKLARLFGEIAFGMKEIIRASDLGRVSQDDLLRSLAAIPVTIKAVADQGRNGGNGASPPERKTRLNKAKSSRLGSPGDWWFTQSMQMHQGTGFGWFRESGKRS